MKTHLILVGFLAGAIASQTARAASGTWTQLTPASLWSAPANWAGGNVADGSSATADFSTLDLAVANTVKMDGAHTLTALSFADTTSPFVSWTLDHNGNVANILTLAGTTPSITVGTSSSATVSTIIAGTTIWTKLGPGTLTLSGTNTFSGGVTVGAGTLKVGGVTSQLGSGTISVTSGATLDLAGNPTYASNTLTLNGTGISSGGALCNSSSSTPVNYSGLVTLGSASSIVATSNLVLTNPGTLTGAGLGLSLGGSATGSGIASSIGTTSGAVTKTGTGNWALAGTNTYSGGTTITAGALSFLNTAAQPAAGITTVAAGASLGLGVATTGNFFTAGHVDSLFAGSLPKVANDAASLVGIDTTAGDFAYNSSVPATTRGLKKLGPNTLSLAGANNYSGATSVTNGLLKVTGTIAAGSAVTVTGGALGGTGTVAGSVTLSGTGGIALANGAVGTLVLGGTLAITGAAGANRLNFDLAAAGGSTDQLTVAGATSVTTTGAAVIGFNQMGGAATPITAGTYTLIQGTAAMAPPGQFALATATAFGQTFTLGVSGNNLQVTTAAATAGPAAAFWKGGADPWSTPANWNTTATSTLGTGASPGCYTNVTFATTTPAAANLTTNALDADFDINSLTFNALAGGVTLGGTRMLTVEATTANGNPAGNGITSSNTSGTNTITAKVGLAANQTWTVAGGGNLTIKGAMSDFGGGYTLTKEGAGTLTLSGANTFSGVIKVNKGILEVRNTPVTAGGLAGNLLVASTGSTGTGGSLQLAANGSITLCDKNIVIQGAGESGGNLTAALYGLQGIITCNGGITLDGSGTYRLYARAMNVPLTDFRINGPIARSGTNTGGLVLQVEGQGANYTVGGLMTLNGTIDNNGGAVTVTGTNLGTLLLNASGNDLGDFTLNGAYTSGASPMFTTVKLGITDALATDKNLTLTKGIFDLAGNHQTVNALSGVTAATRVTNSAAATTSTLTVGNGNGSGATFSGVLENGLGTLALVKTGSGTQILAGANTHSGGTFINAGTVLFNQATALGSGAAVFGGNATLQAGLAATLSNNMGLAPGVTGTFDTQGYAVTLAGTVSGTGGLTKIGAGTLTLTGSNTHNGVTRVSAGTLALASTDTLQNSTLDTGASGSQTVTFTAAGANTYQLGGLQGSNNLAPGANTLSVGTNASNTTFAGVINGSGGLTKTGSGTLTLSGANSYSGVTTVTQGTLAIGVAGLAAATNVWVTSGATLDLTSGTSVSIRKLYLDGLVQASGVYGAPGSGAQFERGCLAGAGTLTVTGATTDEQKAGLFRVFDFTNPALYTYNPGLTAVKTELAKATPNYTTAMTSLWSALPGHNFSGGLSRVTADSSQFAQDFFSWIDLDHPGLETTRGHVLAADYPAALAAWRDYTVAKFRRLGLPQLYQHSYKGHPRQQSIAALLLGETSYANYLAAASGGGIDFYEIYGMAGAPGTNGPINWLAQPATTDTSLDTKYSYASFTFASPLVYRYWSGGIIAGGTNTNLTLTGSGNQATAAFIAPHGLTTGQFINITNALPAAYNGLFRVTVLDALRVSYTTLSPVTSSPATNWSRTASYAREPAALQKWFEILSDFSTRQKSLVSALQLNDNIPNRTTYRTLYSSVDWGVTSGNVLSQGTRMKELLSAIAISCKLLPEVTPVWRDWATVIQNPLTTPLAAGATELIPAEALARIALSLMADTPEALVLRYYKASATPNQRYNGLNALYLDAFCWDEFKAAPELLTQTDAAITDFCNGMFYPEGAMIERSPNYNQGDAAAMRQIITFTTGVATPGITLLQTKLAQYDRVTALMQSPLGGMARMASYTPGNLPALWQSPATVTNWRTSFLKSSFAGTTEPTAAAIYQGMLDSGQATPGATSVAFPYAGYYLMRNGWASRSHFLYFANTAPGNGHKQLDQNGLQISAFGRELLTIAGPPPYDPTFVDASQAADYAGFAAYQGENSAFKCNSVVVDGRSQNEGGIVNPVVTTTPRTNPWFTSADFDYVAGTYSAGYGGSTVYNPLLANGDSGAALTGISHKRGVIFLRQAGVWLVADQLTAAGTTSHSYRQVWNFPARSGTDTLVGFVPGEIAADPASQTIRTLSTSGPNLSLYHLGPNPVTYATSSGSRTPYLGWWSPGIGGMRLATPNIHAVFEGSGTQLLVTALVPADTGTLGPVASAFTPGPLSGSGVVDTSFGLVNGASVRWVQALQPQTILIGNRGITATTLLIVTAPDQSQRGLVVGAVNMAPLPEAFAFTAGPASFSVAAAITTPTACNWSTGSGFSVPSTADASAPNVAAPAGPALPLVTRSFQRTSHGQTISWASEPGKLYQVEWTDNLGEWSRSTPIAAIDTTSYFTDPAPHPTARFYRVRRLP